MAAELIAKGILLGLGAAAPLGPVNVQIARRVLYGGFLPGFALGCGAVSVDVTYAVLSSLSFRWLAEHPAVVRTVSVAGVVLLGYLGVQCLRGEREAFHRDVLKAAPSGRTAPVPNGATRQAGGAAAALGAYVTGLLMTLFNPMTLGFWFVAVPGAGLGANGTEETGRQLPMICAGVFIGTLAWVVFFAGLLSLAGRLRRNWWLAAADLMAGAVLLFIAAVSLWSSVKLFL